MGLLGNIGGNCRVERRRDETDTAAVVDVATAQLLIVQMSGVVVTSDSAA